MSRAYGWTPREIADLTIYQMLFYRGMPVPEMGRIKKSEMGEEAFSAWFGHRLPRGVL